MRVVAGSGLPERMVETRYDLAAQHVSYEAIERQLGPLIESFV